MFSYFVTSINIRHHSYTHCPGQTAAAWRSPCACLCTPSPLYSGMYSMYDVCMYVCMYVMHVLLLKEKEKKVDRLATQKQKHRRQQHHAA